MSLGAEIRRGLQWMLVWRLRKLRPKSLHRGCSQSAVSALSNHRIHHPDSLVNRPRFRTEKLAPSIVPSSHAHAISPGFSPQPARSSPPCWRCPSRWLIGENTGKSSGSWLVNQARTQLTIPQTPSCHHHHHQMRASLGTFCGVMLCLQDDNLLSRTGCTVGAESSTDQITMRPVLFKAPESSRTGGLCNRHFVARLLLVISIDPGNVATPIDNQRPASMIVRPVILRDALSIRGQDLLENCARFPRGL